MATAGHGMHLSAQLYNALHWQQQHPRGHFILVAHSDNASFLSNHHHTEPVDDGKPSTGMHSLTSVRCGP